MYQILINSAVGAALILIWLRFVDIGQIGSSLGKTRPSGLILAVAFLLLSTLIRSLRLKVFLSPEKKIALKDLFFLSGAAMMLNFFIPIRGGDLAKAGYLAGEYDLPIGKSIIWIFLDRALDFLGAVVVAALLINFISSQLPQSFEIILIVLSVIVLVGLYLLSYQVKLSKKIAVFLRTLLIINSIKIYFDNVFNFFLESFQILNRHPKQLFILAFLTVLAYFSDAYIWYVVFLSLGSAQDILKLYLAQLLSALTYLIPAAPGYVGSAEASGLLIFSGVFSINPNLASATIVLFHIITAVFVLIFGISAIFLLKLNLAEILKKILRKN